MMILFVNLQMFGEIRNSVGQKSNLDFRGPGIGFVQLEFLDQFLLIIGCESQFLFRLLLLRILRNEFLRCLLRLNRIRHLTWETHSSNSTADRVFDSLILQQEPLFDQQLLYSDPKRGSLRCHHCRTGPGS